MFLEIGAAYGVIRLFQDILNWSRRTNYKTAERKAATEYNLVPVKGEPDLYHDPDTGYQTRMAYDNGEFHPVLVTEFEITMRGRTVELGRR